LYGHTPATLFGTVVFEVLRMSMVHVGLAAGLSAGEWLVGSIDSIDSVSIASTTLWFVCVFDDAAGHGCRAARKSSPKRCSSCGP
jgi:hypothetical protein